MRVKVNPRKKTKKNNRVRTVNLATPRGGVRL